MNAGHWVMRGWLATGLALMAFTASAGGIQEIRKQAEASVRLTGTVEVAPDGSLRSYRLDHP